MSTWADQIGDLLSAVRTRVAETPGYPLEVAVQANAVEAAWANEPTSYGWRVRCQEYGRASATTNQRLKYDANCGSWGARVSAEINGLTDVLLAAGDTGLAEWAASMNDRVLTAGEQAGAVPPSPDNFEWPWWLKWGLGVIAARELLGVWGAIRK